MNFIKIYISFFLIISDGTTLIFCLTIFSYVFDVKITKHVKYFYPLLYMITFCGKATHVEITLGP